MVMGDDSCSKGRGFQSQHHILDGHFFTLICCKNCNDFCLKRPKINKKDAGVGPFLKNELTRRSQRIVLKSVMVIREYLKADSVLFENLKKSLFFLSRQNFKKTLKDGVELFFFFGFLQLSRPNVGA